MKTLNAILTVSVFILFSCNSEVQTIKNKIDFGISETVKTSEISASIIDSIMLLNVEPDNNLQLPVIGYITKVDTSVLQLNLSKENLKLVRTHYTVDNDKKYYAVFAVRPVANININYIKKTKAKGNNVEIFFTMKGAIKWAELTKKNIGNTLVFVIDNQIYDTPKINAEIRNGAALISLENEMFAKQISQTLNSGIGK